MKWIMAVVVVYVFALGLFLGSVVVDGEVAVSESFLQGQKSTTHLRTVICEEQGDATVCGGVWK